MPDAGQRLSIEVASPHVHDKIAATRGIVEWWTVSAEAAT
jgi:hypothetical protein